MVVGYFRFSPCAFHCWISPSIGIDCVFRTVCDIFGVMAILIRRRHLQLGALAFDAACFCAFDAAGFCIFSFDPHSLESLLLTLAALFRICAHRLGWISSAIYAVFSALVPLRFRRLRALTYNISRCFRIVAFGFAFDISSCVHPLSMSSACSGSASFRIVYIRQPAPQFIPIAFRIAVAFRFAFDMFTFVSYFWRFDFHGFPPQTMPPPAH
jgi:hypothetical protein